MSVIGQSSLLCRRLACLHIPGGRADHNLHSNAHQDMSVNWEKRSLTRTQQTIFIGLALDSPMQAQPTVELVERVQGLICSFFLDARLSVQTLLRLFRMLTSTSATTCLGLLQLCPLWLSFNNIASDPWFFTFVAACWQLRDCRFLLRGIQLGCVPLKW